MATATEPVYLRVLDDLRSKIRSGSLEPGARVPSRNAIITNYGVGETAAKHALAVLLAEGLIEARPGSGCYVREDAGRRVPGARPACVPRLAFRVGVSPGPLTEGSRSAGGSPGSTRPSRSRPAAGRQETAASSAGATVAT